MHRWSRLLYLAGLLAALGCFACGQKRDRAWDSHTQMALTLIQEGQIEAGLEELAQAPEGAGDQPMPTWFPRLVASLLGRRALVPADSLLTLRSSEASTLPDLIMLQAELREYQGRLEDAKKLYRTIPSDSNHHLAALSKIAMIAQMEQQYDEAIEVARAVLAEDGFHKVARAVLAQSLLGQGRAEEAAAELVMLPEGTARWMLDAEVHLARGEPAGALEPLRRVLELTPGAPRPLYLLGKALLGTGQLDLAVKPLAKLAGGKPPYEDSQLLLSTAYRRLGDTAKADSVLAVFRSRRDHEEVEALRGEGVRRSDAGELEVALTYFDRALEIDPDHPELHNDRGTVLARLKRFGEAEREFLRAAVVSPRDPTVQRNLANLYHVTGDTLRQNEALARYRELMSERETP